MALINKTNNINGMSYYEIVFNGGSNIEDLGYKGISHIVEHCMCEQIKSIESELKQYCIFFNAFTASTHLGFFISGLSKYVRQYVAKFTKLILEYDISKEVFERERNIILNEYLDTFSNSSSEFTLNLNRKLYNDCGAIGFIDDIKNITYEKFLEFKNIYYKTPSNIFYCHPKDEDDLTDGDFPFPLNFNDIKIGTSVKVDCTYPIEHYVKNDEQCIVKLIKEIDNISASDYTLLNILSNMLSNGLTSPLYKLLREENELVYSVGCNVIYYIESNKVVFCCTTYTDIKNKNKLKKLLEDIFNNVNKYISESVFQNICKYEQNLLLIDNYTSYGNIDDLKFDFIRQYQNIIMDNKLTYQDLEQFINSKFTVEKTEIYSNDEL